MCSIHTLCFVLSVLCSSYFLFAHSYFSIGSPLKKFLAHIIETRTHHKSQVVHCSSWGYGNLYIRFVWKCTVGIGALWLIQHSICSCSLSSWLASMRKLILLLYHELEWQRKLVKSSKILSGIFCFFAFLKYLADFWCACKLVNLSLFRNNK